MKSIINHRLILFMIAGLLFSCTSDYTELVKKELASGVENDSIFLGIRFGDLRDDFYTKAWDLNKKGLVMQGPKNQTVKYILTTKDTTSSSIRFLFFPVFDKQEKIKEMEITLDYEGWSPWTKRFRSDSLLYAAKDTLMNWYGGNQFIPVEMEKGPFDRLWVKVDGNRRIVIHQKGDREVYGKISDLLNEEVFDNKEL